MAASFFFYDLETSGFSPRSARIMQFAGQRTDMNLKPIGEPVNYYLKLTPDVLPEPDAILLTGITPQKTISEGLSEAEFLKIFYDEIVKPDTIFVGYNNIRFDDEFMRFLNYRNFYDAYEWQWKDGCSRWDLLDVVRMTRALRPDGIKWPFAPDGKPANRLEMLTKVNKLSHDSAHDALSDVYATIAFANLIKTKQPDLFNYLLSLRSKKKVAELVESNEPFIYTSGHFSSMVLHTTAVVLLAPNPTPDSALVYDLRQDPKIFLDMSVAELDKAWQFTKDPDAVRLPVKTIKYNRVPAIAPMGVIKDEATRQRLDLNLDILNQHLATLRKHQASFAKKMLEVVNKLDETRKKTQTTLMYDVLTIDDKLYDGFIDKSDQVTMRAVRAANPEAISSLSEDLKDKRLKVMLPLYKARNYTDNLTAEERVEWDKFIAQKLLDGGTDSRLAKFFKRLEEVAQTSLNKNQEFLVEELKLYAESIMPDPEI